MGKKILILLMLGVMMPLYSAEGRAVPRTKEIDNAAVSCQVVDKELQQEYCTYKRNGKVRPFSGQDIYENGGKERMYIPYKNGYREGMMRYYDSEGRIRLEANYGHGLLNGVYKEYHENRTYSKRLVYKNGLLQGTQDLYDEKGKLLGRFKYRRGVLESGYCKDYSRKRNKKRDLTYKEIKAAPFNELFSCDAIEATTEDTEAETTENTNSTETNSATTDAEIETTQNEQAENE